MIFSLLKELECESSLACTLRVIDKSIGLDVELSNMSPHANM